MLEFTLAYMETAICMNTEMCIRDRAMHDLVTANALKSIAGRFRLP